MPDLRAATSALLGWEGTSSKVRQALYGEVHGGRVFGGGGRYMLLGIG